MSLQGSFIPSRSWGKYCLRNEMILTLTHPAVGPDHISIPNALSQKLLPFISYPRTQPGLTRPILYVTQLANT